MSHTIVDLKTKIVILRKLIFTELTASHCEPGDVGNAEE